MLSFEKLQQYYGRELIISNDIVAMWIIKIMENTVWFGLAILAISKTLLSYFY